VGGQKTNGNNDCKIIIKIKTKKFQKRQFLILFLTQENTFLITPHPNPLPASGERGLEGVFLLLQEEKLMKLSILI